MRKEAPWPSRRAGADARTGRGGRGFQRLDMPLMHKNTVGYRGFLAEDRDAVRPLSLPAP